MLESFATILSILQMEKVCFLALAFVAFHFLTDEVITSIWHEKAHKPYVTELLGDFGIINIAVAFVILLIYLIYDKKQVE